MAQKSNSKRRDKTALKRKQKKAALAKRAIAKKTKSRRVRKSKPLMLPEEYVFWVMHGCNFLVSDYDNGVWNPIFPEIYEGVTPQAEKVAERILDWFKDKEDKTLEQLVIGWTAQEVKVIHIYYLGSIKGARDANPNLPPGEVLDEARKPMCSTTWEVFNMLKTDMSARMKAREKNDGD